MNVRERLEAAMDGRTPDKTPLSIYGWFFGDGPRNLTGPARELIERGMGYIHHVNTVASKCDGVERVTEEKQSGGHTYHIRTQKTPVGDLQYVTKNGWHYESWIKEPADYKIWQWMVENTEYRANYDVFAEAQDIVRDEGIVIVNIGRTPAMQINVDIAGTERFCMDLAMEVPELLDLYHAMVKRHREMIELVAAGPGRYIKWLENLTISMLGPDRYRDLLVSVYDECVPLLAAADKRTMVHYDGQLGCIKDHIAAAPIHAIESLTEPPEGDLMYDEARAAWPDKAFWANINVALYYDTPEVLRQAVIDKRARAGKQGLAFEISEDMPRNWEQSIPVVMDALEELD